MKNVHPIIWGVVVSFIYWILIVIAGLTFGFPGVILFLILTFFIAIGASLGFAYNEEKKKRK